MNILSYQLLSRDEQIVNLLSPKQPTHSKSTERSLYNPNLRIEQQLLTKYAKSQAKISALRLKKQREEAQLVQPAPKINKTSKEIAELLEGKSENTVSGYASRVVSSCRSSSGFTMHPKQSFISLAALSEENEEPIKPLKIQHKKSESQKGFQLSASIISETIKKKVDKRQEEIEAQRVRMEDLRRVIANRQRTEEEEVMSEPLYEMGILERNQFWLDRKNQRLQIKKEEKIVEEIKDCTFTPTLAPRVNLNKSSRPYSQNSNGYADRNKKKSLGSTFSKPSKQTEDHPKPPVTSLYKALSPHCKTLQASGSLSLLKNAVPMLPYKT